MADKAIYELPAAETVQNADLLVLEQGGMAKKLSGELLGDYVYAAAAEKIAEVEQAVADAQAAVDDLEEQEQTIIDRINAALDQGTDPTLSQEGWPADAAATGVLKTEITGISDGIESATVNPEIDRAVNGVTVKESNGKLIMYGTATAARNYCFLNGQDAIKASTSEFEKTLDAGTYLIETDATGYQTTYTIRATYSAFASGSAFIIANSDNKSRVITFSAPAMVAVLEQEGRDYGTEANPTYLSFSAKRIVAKDPVAREAAINAVKYSVQSLTDSEAEQARANIDGVGNDTLYAYNFYDAIELGNGSSGTSNGIEYTKNSDGTWTIERTDTSKTGASFKNIISSTSAVPRYIIPGRKYKFSFNGGTVPVRVFLYNSGGNTAETYSSDFEIAFPNDLTGVLIRFQIDDVTAFNQATVKYTLIPETVTSIDNHYTYNTTVQKTENIYNNTYEQTVSPTITTDTNGWLQAVDTASTSEANATDMAPAIMAMLNETGYCHLGEGLFFVSGNIDMPDNSTLCGCGNATKIRLLSSVTTGYAVRMQRYCTVKDIAFSGSGSGISPTADGGRDAIHFTANKDGTEQGASSTTRHCMIDNVWITNFSGSGIYCHNTSQSVSQGLYVSNAYIMSCYAGINIDYMAEFCKFTNCMVGSCFYGCINNGGNNVFTSCTFHATSVGFYIDGTKENAGHGTINGCTFCHIGDNNGTAISFNSIDPGFVVANCQIWYGAIEVSNSTGILFDGCMFGRGRASDKVDDKSVCASITVSGGNLVLFSGCMFHLDVQRPPKIETTNNTKTIFIGCYGTESGLPITG